MTTSSTTLTPSATLVPFPIVSFVILSTNARNAMKLPSTSSTHPTILDATPVHLKAASTVLQSILVMNATLQLIMGSVC